MENCKGLGTTKMYEHECESDEDCEVYFLKPVNEYNIVDKIKAANKELFADDAEAVTNTAVTSSSDEASTLMNTNKKVTFATNLEDFEPITATTELQEDSTETDSKQTDVSVHPTDGIQQKLAADFKFPIIDEEELDREEIGEILEEDLQVNNDVSTKSKNKANAEILHDTDENNVANNNKNKKNKTDDTEAAVFEEICEEIITMDMENGNELQKFSSVEGQLRSKIIKQATFDYDESDNKSLTNLLTSDFEDDETDEEYNKSADGDDDDQLSIIVASYIPDNFDKESLVSETNSSGNTQKVTKNKKISFTKRFSFRRKKSSSANIPTSSASSDAISCRHVPPPEVTDLKLNYKTCCEYRNAVQEKLPKYTGYLSEYGLTREQLAKREAKLQQKQRFVLEKALTANDQEMRKMQDNERAFTTWLKQKMRFPLNKTRNMFDVRRLPGGCGSGSAVRNRSGSGKIK